MYHKNAVRDVNKIPPIFKGVLRLQRGQCEQDFLKSCIWNATSQKSAYTQTLQKKFLLRRIESWISSIYIRWVRDLNIHAIRYSYVRNHEKFAWIHVTQKGLSRDSLLHLVHLMTHHVYSRILILRGSESHFPCALLVQFACKLLPYQVNVWTT